MNDLTTTPGQKARRLALVLALAAGLGGVAAAPAMAATEQYLTSYAVGSGGAYASGTAHTGVQNSHKDGTGVICPAVAQGYGAFTGSPNSGGNFTAGSNCGTGDRTWYPNGTANITFHGAVWNQNFGSQGVTYGRYTWF